MYRITINNKSFEASDNISLFDAATQSGISLPYSCKTGRCSTCKCKVISGKTKAIIEEVGLTEIEKAEGWILSCVRSASSDATIEIEDLGNVTLPPAQTHVCRINNLKKLAPDVIKVDLRLPPRNNFRFIPGQFIDILGPGGIRRSYSIANAPRSDNSLELHIRAVENGAMSQYWFNEASVNDTLRFHGPHGTFFLRDVTERDLVFLATGTGIAPIKSIIESLFTYPKNNLPLSVVVLWGGRKEHDLYFDVESLSDTLRFIPVLSRSETWNGEHGHIQDVLLRQKPDLNNCSVYACGSNTMIQSAISTLTAAGLPSKYFYSDAFVCSGNFVE